MTDYYKTNKKLVSFLYLLCRDHLSFGKIEELRKEVLDYDGYHLLCAKELGEWAEGIANDLTQRDS